MRRIVVMSIIGLGLAFGAFYYFSWPTTLSGRSGGDEISFPDAPPEQQLHTGQFLFEVSGRHRITIVTVRLNDPSSGFALVAARVGLGDSGASIGTASGPTPEIEALPRAPGFVLNPRDTGAFVITIRAFGPGDFVFHGITVTYQTGWLTRSITFGPTVKVKVPADISPVPTPTST